LIYFYSILNTPKSQVSHNYTLNIRTVSVWTNGRDTSALASNWFKDTLALAFNKAYVVTDNYLQLWVEQW